MSISNINKFLSVCRTDEDCIKGRICSDGLCAKPPLIQCSVDRDCPDGHKCKQNKCLHEQTNINTPNPRVCTSHGDCPNGGKCYGGICVNPGAQSCKKDNDCPNGKLCRSGLCIRPHTVPGQPPISINPIVPNRICKNDRDCKPPNICKRKGRPAKCTVPIIGNIALFEMET